MFLGILFSFWAAHLRNSLDFELRNILICDYKY
jgi:hypothetical protein